MAHDEQQTIKMCIQGDQKAWEIIYRSYASKVKAFVRTFMFSMSESEDLCQEIFLELFRALPSFREESSLSTFLLRISKNKCISVLRKKMAQKRVREDRNVVIAADAMHDGTNHSVVEDSSLPLEESVIQKEESEYIVSLIPELSEDCQKIIKMRFFFCLSYAQMCENMLIPMGTLCSKLKRCLMYLKKNYKN